MDIKSNNLMLVEIKHLIRTEDMDIWNYKNELTTLIDEAIARQSVKSEEVADAIALLEILRETAKDNTFVIHRIVVRLYNLAITARQEYQPWIPVSESMAIESDLRNGMVLAWSTELCEWLVENWGFVEDRPDDYNHWIPLQEQQKGE